MNAFEKLKVGDLVILEGTHDKKIIQTVSKVTAKQIVIGRGFRFRRKDGCEIGKADSWYSHWIKVPTEAEIEEARAATERARMVSYIKNLKTADMSNDRLRSICNAIKGELSK